MKVIKKVFLIFILSFLLINITGCKIENNDDNNVDDQIYYPQENSNISISEALLLEIPEGNKTPYKYYIEGTISSIEDNEKGSLYITDGINSIYIMELFDKDGKTSFSKMPIMPQVGDSLIVYGYLKCKNDSIYIPSGVLEDLVIDEDNDTSFTLIEDVKKAQLGKYKVKGQVIAKNAQSFILKDSSSQILVYMGSSWQNDVEIGDVLQLEGTTTTYGNAIQFSNDSLYKNVSSSTVSYPNYKTLTGSGMNSYLYQSKIEIEYVRVEAKLSVSGSYYNFTVEGSSLTGTITYPLNSQTLNAMNGKEIIITGYVTGISGSNTKYLNILAVNVVLKNNNNDNDNKEIIDIKTIKESPLGEYKTSGIVIAANSQSFILQDNTDKILVYKGSSWEQDLSGGEEITLTGTTTVYGNAIQFGNDSTYSINGFEYPPYEDYSELTIEEANSYIGMEDIDIKYVCFTGVLSKSGNYYNVVIQNANVTLSISYPINKVELDSYDGKNIKVIGYITGLVSNKYLNILATEVRPTDDVIIDPTTNKVNFFMINDTHGAFVDEGNYPGIARVSGLIDALESANGEYIKLANGDIFQGTYISSTLKGLPLVDALNVIDFDAFILGNHEFDWGIEEIAKYKDGDLTNGEADFPFLGANIIEKSTGDMLDWVEPYTIIDYNNSKVGIIGVIGSSQESSILSMHVEKYDFINPIYLIEEYAAELRIEKDCDVVVVASHDFDETLNSRIASLSGNSEIDAIFCAHTHQNISSTLTRSDGVTIPVVQNHDKNETATSLVLELNNYKQMTSFTVNKYYPMNYQPDNDLDVVYDKYNSLIEKGNEVLGYTSSTISKSTLGYYATSAMKEEFDVDVSIINTGGVRDTIKGGDITISDVFSVFPFENEIMLVSMTGRSIKSLYNSNSSYLYFNNDFNTSSLSDSLYYDVAVIDYVFTGAYYNEFKGLAYTDTNIVLRDILIDYIDESY